MRPVRKRTKDSFGLDQGINQFTLSGKINGQIRLYPFVQKHLFKILQFSYWLTLNLMYRHRRVAQDETTMKDLISRLQLRYRPGSSYHDALSTVIRIDRGGYDGIGKVDTSVKRP